MGDDAPRKQIGDRFNQWAMQSESIHVLVQIGSRLRSPKDPAAPDERSGWDFQVVTDNLSELESRATMETSVGASALAFVARAGGVAHRKVTAVFPSGEIDVAILTSSRLIAGEPLQTGIPTGKPPEYELKQPAFGGFALHREPYGLSLHAQSPTVRRRYIE